jgi:epoxyqueuosine reductase
METAVGPGARDRRDEVRAAATAAGFDRAGFARAGPAPHAAELREWLARGFASSMSWLERAPERRADPREVLPGARTVIVLAVHYGEPGEEDRSCRSGAEAERLAACGGAEISRYARGADYHRVLEGRLKAFCAALRALFPGDTFRYYVDTGPVLERDWAQAAGIGWIGKNACAIDPSRGSYFFLAEVLATAEIEPDPPAVDRCGTCSLCLESCPTGAIVSPRVVDARRCISTLTIEERGPIAPELRPGLGGLVFGCDICQEVCPFNRTDRLRGDPELSPRPENRRPSLESLAALDAEAFARRFPRSAVRRARLAGLLRSVATAAGNGAAAGGAGLRAVLERLAGREDVRADPVLAEAVESALRRSRPGA